MDVLMPYLLVGVGGVAGAIARFEVGRWVARLIETPFPLGTFVINVSGSFLLGVVGALAAGRLSASSEMLRLALGVGFLGAFTTFSTFELETHGLLEHGSWLLAAAYVAASVFLGLIAVRAGMTVVRVWWP